MFRKEISHTTVISIEILASLGGAKTAGLELTILRWKAAVNDTTVGY